MWFETSEKSGLFLTHLILDPFYTESPGRGLLSKKIESHGRGVLWKKIFLKETPTQVFSCEYCEILKNNSFEELVFCDLVTFSQSLTLSRFGQSLMENFIFLCSGWDSLISNT